MSIGSNDKYVLTARAREQLRRDDAKADQRLANRYWIPTLGDFRGIYRTMARHYKSDETDKSSRIE